MIKPSKLLVATALVVGLSGGSLWADDTDADNTGKNVRDRSEATLTPFDQSETEADRTLTQRIRQAVVEDDSLSTNAKNVKIVTVNGVVTLRGPVDSDAERQRVLELAQQIAGDKKVNSQLELNKQ